MLLLSTVLTSVGVGVALTSPFWVDRLFADNGIVFTKPKEGTVQAIMNGNAFNRFVMVYSGHKFKGTGGDDERWEIIPDTTPKKNPWNIFGWKFVGIPFAQNVHQYKLSWREMQQDGKESKVVARTNVSTNFAFATRFPYSMVLPDGETHGGDGEIIPVTLEYVAIIRITNPYKALFMNEDWPQIIESILNEIAKDYAASKTYEELIKEQTSRHKEGGFSDRILCAQEAEDTAGHTPGDGPGPGKSIKEWVSETYGVTIENAYLLKIDPLGEYRELTQERTISVVAADVRRKKVEGERDAMRILADGKAYDIRKVGKANAKAFEVIAKTAKAHEYGLDILKLLTLDKVGANGNTVIVTNGLSSDSDSDSLIKAAAARLLNKDNTKPEEV